MASFFHSMLVFITTSLQSINSQQQSNYYINSWTYNQKSPYLQYPTSHSIAGLTSNATEGEYTGAIEILISSTTSQTQSPGSLTALSSNWAAGNPGMYGQLSCKQSATKRTGCDYEAISNPNSMVVVNHAMYFSRYIPDYYATQDISTTNFYKHSVHFTDSGSFNNYSTIHLGKKYPKEAASYDECYTTDNTQYIYLIGGRTASGRSSTFMWFDLLNYKWHKGPDLSPPRAGSACIYHTNTSTIYLFGGDDTTMITKWKKGAGIWDTVASQMNATAYSIYAFEAPNSNTIFVVGADMDIIPYSAGRSICYTFLVDKEELFFCVNTPLITTNFGSVYDSQQMVFYSIGGMYNGAVTNYVQYTKLSTSAPIDFSSSNAQRKASSTAKIPIKYVVANAYTRQPPHGDTKIKFAKVVLYSLELDIDNAVLLRSVYKQDAWNVDYNCSVCEATEIKCTNCLDGIDMKYTMPYNGKQVRNHIYHVDAISVQHTYALASGFDVILSDTYFVTFSLPTVISLRYNSVYVKLTHYQFAPNTNYTFLLSTDNPVVKFDAKVKVSTNSNDVSSCHIINYKNISTCNEGFVPKINFRALQRYHNRFNITVSTVLGNTIIDIYPTDTFIIKVQQMQVTFNRSTHFIMPGQIIPISIVSYSNLTADKWYLFNLASSVPKYQVDASLNIQTAWNSSAIQLCTLGAANITHPTFCSFGVRPNIHYDPTTNNTFALTISPLNTAAKLVYVSPFDGIPVQVIPCKAGYGVADVTNALCVECVFNSFKLKSGVHPCWKCNHSLEGVSCEGGKSVQISYNYWISALDSKQKPHSLLQMQESDTLFSSFCANGWCCSNANGCDYLHDNDSLCAKNRDINTPLCGACVEGTSELFGTQNCGECDETNYGFIGLIMIFVVLPLVSYIAYFESAPYKIPIAHDQKDALESIISLIFDVIIYYYQSLSIILTSNGMTISSWFQSFIFSLFSLHAVHVSDSDGICIIAQLDAFDKLILNFLFPLMTVPVLMFLFVIRKYSLDEILCLNKCNTCKCECECKYLQNRKPHIYSCFVRILLLYVGVSLGTLLQLLTIIRLGNSPDSEALYFYAPTRQMTTSVFVIAIVAMCIIGCVFVYIFYVLYRKTNDERFDANENEYFSFVQSFNTQQWFWQFVILFRRIMIQMSMSLNYLSPQVVTLCLTTFIFIYFGIQIHFKPFKDTGANAVEIMNLGLLGVILFSINIDLDHRIFDGLLFIAALLPVLSLICAVIYEVLVALKQRNYEEKHVPLLQESGMVSS